LPVRDRDTGTNSTNPGTDFISGENNETQNDYYFNRTGTGRFR